MTSTQDISYYRDVDGQIVAIRSGMPGTAIEIGFGDDREEAVANLSATPIGSERGAEAAWEWVSRDGEMADFEDLVAL